MILNIRNAHHTAIINEYGIDIIETRRFYVVYTIFILLGFIHQLASTVERHIDVGANVILANQAVESGAFKRLLHSGRNA